MKWLAEKIKFCKTKIKNFSQTLMILFIGFTPALAWADGDSPVGSGLGYIISALTGTTGIAIATIAVMGHGLACLFHFFQWHTLLYTIGGISIVWGAPAAVKAIIALLGA